MNSLLLSAESVLDTFEPITLYLTIGVLASLIIAGLIVFFAKRRIVSIYAKYALFGFALYALVIGIFMLVLNILKYYGDGGKYENTDIARFVFLPILITLILIFAFSIAIFILNKTGKNLKTLGLVASVVCGISLITTLILVAKFFGNNIDGDGYYTGYGKLNSGVLYASAGLLIVCAILAAILIDKKGNLKFDTRCIAFAGISIALSFALSYIKLFSLPQGGSVTLASMLPIMLFSYVYGIKKGMIIGLIYGLLQAVQDPYIVHPAQFLLDYPIAFALTSFAGIFANTSILNTHPQIKFAVSSLIGALLRFISHVLSGVFAFGAYAIDAGQNNFFLYSVAYNSFVFVDIALVIVVGVILFSSHGFTRELSKFTASTVDNTDNVDSTKQA